MHCLRDATRGGVATVLNEFAAASRSCLEIDETALPVRKRCRGVCELLGLDPLYLANEGKLVAVVPAPDAETRARGDARSSRRPAGGNHRRGHRRTRGDAWCMQTLFGGTRIVDMLVGEQLPRIC